MDYFNKDFDTFKKTFSKETEKYKELVSMFQNSFSNTVFDFTSKEIFDIVDEMRYNVEKYCREEDIFELMPYNPVSRRISDEDMLKEFLDEIKKSVEESVEKKYSEFLDGWVTSCNEILEDYNACKDNEKE
jgi:hypothetical protein